MSILDEMALRVKVGYYSDAQATIDTTWLIARVRELETRAKRQTGTDTSYPWAYGFLRSAVDGALELLNPEDCAGDDSNPRHAYNRLKDAVERIDEELK